MQVPVNARQDIDADAFAHNNFGQPAIRLGFGLDLYFGRPMDAYRDQIGELWSRLLSWRGRPHTWCRLGGGSRSRKASGAVYKRVGGWLSGAESYDDHCFINLQNGEYEQIGDESFELDANNRAHDGEDDCDINFIQLRLPLSVLDELDDLTARILDLVDPVDFACGTAGLMLHTDPFGPDRLWKEKRALIERFPGVEPSAAHKVAWMAREGLGGVNWMTFVGSIHLDELGGREHLLALASDLPGIEAQPTRFGAAIRAGRRPVTGEGGVGLGCYGAVYELLRPALYLLGDFGLDDEDFDARATLEWQRRFERL